LGTRQTGLLFCLTFWAQNKRDCRSSLFFSHNTNGAAVLPDFFGTKQTGLLFCPMFQAQHNRGCTNATVVLPDFLGTTQTGLLFCLFFRHNTNGTVVCHWKDANRRPPIPKKSPKPTSVALGPSDAVLGMHKNWQRGRTSLRSSFRILPTA